MGTEMYLCEVGSILEEKVIKNSTHLTLLGLTLFSGEPLMCVVIFEGAKSSM